MLSSRKFFIVLLAFFSLLANGAHSQKTKGTKPKVLVFTKTNGYKHASIPQGVEAIKKLGEENNFSVTDTGDSTWFVKDTLQQYAAVIFLSTTGNVLGTAEEEAFINYIKSGGGYMGIHAAADCEYTWPWYGELVGGYFKSHPKQQSAKITVVDKSNIATKHLPEVWERFDEWYNYKNLNPSIHVLMTLDEKSYTGGENGDNHPIAWYHSFDGGRAFYTGLGHTPESYTEPLFLQHILGGIKYAIGKN